MEYFRVMERLNTSSSNVLGDMNYAFAGNDLTTSNFNAIAKNRQFIAARLEQIARAQELSDQIFEMVSLGMDIEYRNWQMDVYAERKSKVSA